jgi:hypothetical protein
MKSLHSLRRWYSPLVILLVLGGVMIGCAPITTQSGGATSSAIPSNTAPSIGEQIEVAISIDVSAVDPPDDALGSFTGSLDWNPAILIYTSDSGILAGFTGVVNDSDASSGHIVFNGAQASGATGNVTVFSITFDVVGSGSSNLDLEYSAMAAAITFENLLPLLTVNDSQVQVQDQGSPAEYTLSIAVAHAEGRTASPAVGVHTYTDGTVGDITATPAAGYEFDHRE